MVSSPSFTEKDLSLCASYFVENYPWKGIGSDFCPSNPRFVRFPYNYIVPYESYVIAHQKFGDPLPSPMLSPSSKVLNVGAVMEEMLGSTRERNIDGFAVALGGYSYDGCRLEVKESDGKVVGFVMVLKKDLQKESGFLIAGKSLCVRYQTLDYRYEPSIYRIAEAVGDALMQWERSQQGETW